MAEIDYKKKCEEYEKKLGIGQNDPAKDGYQVLVKILNAQNNFLGDFNLKSKIASDEKADVIVYKNAKDLWENLPTMISKINALKAELKIEEEDKLTMKAPISAKEIANGKDV